MKTELCTQASTDERLSSPPEVVEKGWIQAAHRYTIAFEIICHSLEICGLRSQTVNND